MITLPSEEKIIVFTRRHSITLILKMALFSFSLLITVAAAIMIFNNVTQMENLYPILFSVIIFIILFHLIFSFIYFTNWYLDVWIVTDKRIIDIEQTTLFNSESSEFMLEKVQDVSVDKIGFLANIFNYGDIHIQTAGMSRVFIFKQVPNPRNIKDCLMKCIDDDKGKNVE